MQLLALDEFSRRIVTGEPCPWSVLNIAGELLLAQGLVVRSDEMAEALKERGAFVVVDEGDAVPVVRPDPAAPAPPAFRFDIRKTLLEEDTLTGRWVTLEARIGGVLRGAQDRSFPARLHETMMRVAATAQKHSDELVYLILRHDHRRMQNYGVAHALHCAALCALLARRLRWNGPRSISLLGAALTMNLSILDLQGKLATLGGRPTAAQHRMIQDHPLQSADMLRSVGISDIEWLQTVEQHHEAPGGAGYPRRLEAPAEMAQLLRLVDIFTAKHSPRTGRGPLPAHQAARDLFLHSQNDPFAHLLIKELGIYPPGCYVRLANEEIAVVTHVGRTARTPRVAVVLDRDGDTLLEPVPRDTAEAAYAIQRTVPDSAVKVSIPPERIYARRLPPA